MKKRILSFVLAVLILFSSVSVIVLPAAAEQNGSCGENVTWEFDKETGTLCISGNGAMYDYTSTSMPWYEYRKLVKVVTVGEGVTAIGNFAFSYCEAMTTVNIAQSVTDIGTYAFYKSSALSEIILPSESKSIGDKAFGFCTSLVSIELPENLNTVSNYAFYYCSALSAITLPETVSFIGEYAFAYTAITTVTIPVSVSEIGDCAFNDCNALNEIAVTEGNGAYTAENGVLYNKDKTVIVKYPSAKEETSFVIPETVTEIAKCAFYKCTVLTSVTMHDGIATVNDNAFDGCTNISDLSIPASITYIGERAFSQIKYITEIIIPSGIEVISSGAFSGCQRVKNIVIPDGVREIGYAAFAQILSVEKIKLPESVTVIDDFAFQGCDALVRIDIPAGVTSIGERAFFSCDVFEFVYFGGTKTQWENILIGDQNDSLESANVFCLTDGTGWDFDETTGTLTIFGNGYTPDYSDHLDTPWYKYYSQITNVVIQEGVTGLGNHSFRSCTTLESISFPEGFEYIGTGALQWTSISELNLPSSLKTIKNYAFYGVSTLKSVVIPDGTLNIGTHAFMQCVNLSAVVLPVSLTEIKTKVFEDCSNSLVINYKGTKSQWNAIDPTGSIIYQVIFEEEETETANYSWIFDADSGTLTVSGTGAVENFAQSSQPWYSLKDSITNLVVEEGITAIGNYAFFEFPALEKITFADSVTEIGKYAFYNCSALKTVEFSDNTTTIGSYAFFSCETLADVVFPEELTSIGDYSFYACSSIESLVLPSKIQKVGNNSFQYCKGLKELTISEGVQYIGQNSFYSTAISSLYVPGTVTYIDSFAFSQCASLTNLTLCEGTETIKNGAFDACAFESVTLPATVIKVDGGQFMHNENLQNIYVAEGSETYSSIDGVLFNKEGNTLVSFPSGRNGVYTVPDGTEYIGGLSFYWCTLITGIIIPEGVKEIMQYGFYYATALKTVQMPESIYQIELYAFRGCSSLETVNTAKTVSGWEEMTVLGGNDLFLNADIIYRENFSWSFDEETATLTVSGQGPMDNYKRTVVTSGSYTYNYPWYDIRNNIKKVVIEEGITTIGQYAFCDLRNLESVYVADGVTSVGDYAFNAHNNLSEVLLPDSVTYIGDYAFYSCDELEFIELPENLEYIGYQAFIACKALKNITIPSKVTFMEDGVFQSCYNLEWARICSDLDQIAPRTFRYCSKLDNISFTDSIVSISSSAFEGADALATIYYGGKQSQWDAVKIGDNNVSANVAAVFTMPDDEEFEILSASVVIRDNLTFNFKIHEDLFKKKNFKNPYIIFEMDGEKHRVNIFDLADGKFIFGLDNIAPHMMKTKLYVTLFAEEDGREYISETKEISIADYCQNILENENYNIDEELRTLIVDMLDYGTHAQYYCDHKTNKLANSEVKYEHREWASEDKECQSVKNSEYKKHDNPKADWTGVGLNLKENVAIRVKFTAQTLENVYLKVVGDENYWIVDSSEFVATEDGAYYAYFDGLNAGQMSETVYFTLYQDGVAVSNTFSYSIESYVHENNDTTDTDLWNLLKSMMRYGHSANKYKDHKK